MTSLLYTEAINTCLETINAMPVGEIRYYLLLTVNSLKKVETELNKEMLKELTEFSRKLSKLMRPENGAEFSKCLAEINQHYQNLLKFSQTRTLSVQIGYALINLGAAITAFLTGIIGGLIGGFAGLARSAWNLSNPFSAFIVGTITGFMLGAAFGFRAPKKLFKDELTRQLKFCLDGIAECMHNIEENIVEPFAYYEEQVKEMLLPDYFNNDEEAYEEFKNSKNLSYEITTASAQFISKGPSLERYLGHHARISFTIGENHKPIVIEFVPERDATKEEPAPRAQTQGEERTVSGKKLVEMLALHKQLKVTHACTTGYILTKMKPGDRDCFSYVNMILSGTGQEATTLKRFDGSENWIGKNVVGFFIQNTSPFQPDILHDRGGLHSLT